MWWRADGGGEWWMVVVCAVGGLVMGSCGVVATVQKKMREVMWMGGWVAEGRSGWMGWMEGSLVVMRCVGSGGVCGRCVGGR